MRMNKFNDKKNRSKNILISIISFVVLLSVGIVYANANKPANIKYGNIDIQATKSTISTVNVLSEAITSTKPGIKISVNTNENDDEMFYKMLNGEVDIILPSREMNSEEEALAEENNIAFKKLPFAMKKDGSNETIYMYINDMNYNHKPENKVFAKNFFGDGRNSIVTTDITPLSNEEYDKVIDYLKLIDEF